MVGGGCLDSVANRLGALAVTANHHHGCAQLCQSVRGRFTYARVRAGHKAYFAGDDGCLRAQCSLRLEATVDGRPLCERSLSPLR